MSQIRITANYGFGKTLEAVYFQPTTEDKDKWLSELKTFLGELGAFKGRGEDKKRLVTVQIRSDATNLQSVKAVASAIRRVLQKSIDFGRKESINEKIEREKGDPECLVTISNRIDSPTEVFSMSADDLLSAIS